MKLTIELPDGYEYATKVNGQPIMWKVGEAHPSWLQAVLEKGLQRFANDKYSGEKGQTKYELIAAMAAEFNAGKAMPEPTRRAGGASLTNTQSMAVKLAKDTLMIAFKSLTDCAKIADMCDKDERVAAYFDLSGDRPTWRDDVVLEWIGKQREAGKRDYIAEAEAMAEQVSDIDI